MADYVCFAVVNGLTNSANLSYLEIGLFHGDNFAKVDCLNKYSVDNEVHGPSPTFLMTTDDFFATIKPDFKFDVIFIDACHDYEQVVKDYNNAVLHLRANGVILLHDMVPPTEQHTGPILCSDGYKLLYHFLTSGEKVLVHVADYGLTAMVNPGSAHPPPECKATTYGQLLDELNKIKRLTSDEMIDEINKRRDPGCK